MKIFTAAQLRAWDQYTISEEHVHSIELMERAAVACTSHLEDHFGLRPFIILAGVGNNGGDGLAIARLLKQRGRDVSVYQISTRQLSPDCEANLQRLKPFGIPFDRISNVNALPMSIPPEAIVIDAILGSGLNRPLEGLEKDVTEAVNRWGNTVIAIDIPTGLIADASSTGNTVMRASYTLSFQVPKLCFFLPENEPFVGEWILLDIGLSPSYYANSASRYELTESADLEGMLRPRARFAHKGNFGTAMLMGGSKGMMGAAILAARACLRSGVGKLITRVPGCGLNLMQVAVPEAICTVDDNSDFLANMPADLSGYDSIGIGPGIGKDGFTRDLIDKILRLEGLPMVWDADALNIIAGQGWQERIPEGSVITPHIGEFSRLFGTDPDHLARLNKAMDLAGSLGIFIIVKGQNSFLATPNGKGYFNSTGNPGMAKAGSGDVLTGMITGLLAQKYPPEQACRIAMYIHGMAGDMAKIEHSTFSITASDLIEKIGFCYAKIFNN